MSKFSTHQEPSVHRVPVSWVSPVRDEDKTVVRFSSIAVHDVPLLEIVILVGGTPLYPTSNCCIFAMEMVKSARCADSFAALRWESVKGIAMAARTERIARTVTSSATVKPLLLRMEGNIVSFDISVDLDEISAG